MRLLAAVALWAALQSFSVTADVQFAPLQAALTNSAKRHVLASTTDTVALGLNVLLRSGDVPSQDSVPYGQLVDRAGTTIYQESAAGVSTKPDISDNPDFQSLHRVPNGKLYLMSHFEYPLPSPVFISELQQDQATGRLTVLKTQPANVSSIGGAWCLCAGQVTPWGSRLAGEEYEPDARLVELATSISGPEYTSLLKMDPDYTWINLVQHIRYFGKYQADGLSMAQLLEFFNPYMYGMAIEFKVGRFGTVESERLYTMGRNSKELAFVMPDRKTVYITDDGNNVGFFKFVASKPGNLRAGTLYAAKFTQTSAVNGGSFDISWITLGYNTNYRLQAKAASGLKFSDMFDYVDPVNGACPQKFTSINQGDRLQECLRLKPMAKPWAPFFETRRYAAMLGATTEFNKWEGLTFSPSRNKLYTSMTDIRYGMEDNKKRGSPNPIYDRGGNNDVRLPWNRCGCVYSLVVDASYNAVSMAGELCGSTQGNVDGNNVCSVDGIANPDNLSIMEEHDTLIIAEDSGTHQNNFVWAYHLDSGSLTRIASTPYDAEATAVYYQTNFNGFNYLWAAAQHPYGETDFALVSNPYSEGTAGYVGYFVVKDSDISGRDIQFEAVPVPRSNETMSKFFGSPTLVVGGGSA